MEPGLLEDIVENISISLISKSWIRRVWVFGILNVGIYSVLARATSLKLQRWYIS